MFTGRMRPEDIAGLPLIEQAWDESRVLLPACGSEPPPRPRAMQCRPGHEMACHFPERPGHRSEVATRAMDFAAGGPAAGM